MYTWNIRVSRYLRQILIELRGDRDKSTNPQLELRISASQEKRLITTRVTSRFRRLEHNSSTV
jgi:hypothetical protein